MQAEQPDIEIKMTDDGSATLFNKALNETYHSTKGAFSESLHVYINNGLEHKLRESKTIHVLEVGFGTGLNTLLTMMHTPADCKIYYTSIEPFPISPEMAKQYFKSFNYDVPGLRYLDSLLQAKSGEPVEITQGFNFCIFNDTLQNISNAVLNNIWNKNSATVFSGFDLVYYDAFAPSRQPEMWAPELLQQTMGMMKPGALLTTYCAQGQFKRNLKSMGFNVISPRGFGGKHEMVNAIKPTAIK